MRNSFRILSGFLDRFGDEVQGRQSTDLPPDLDSRLRQLACGSLPATQHSDLFVHLRDHPQWIDRLAEQVKALRPPTPPKPASPH